MKKQLSEKIIQVLDYWNMHSVQNITVVSLLEILQWISL